MSHRGRKRVVSAWRHSEGISHHTDKPAKQCKRTSSNHPWKITLTSAFVVSSEGQLNPSVVTAFDTGNATMH